MVEIKQPVENQLPDWFTSFFTFIVSLFSRMRKLGISKANAMFWQADPGLLGNSKEGCRKHLGLSKRCFFEVQHHPKEVMRLSDAVDKSKSGLNVVKTRGVQARKVEREPFL